MDQKNTCQSGGEAHAYNPNPWDQEGPESEDRLFNKKLSQEERTGDVSQW